MVSIESWLCHLHNVTFSVEWKAEKPDGVAVCCPLCLQAERDDYRKQLAQVREHRDLMVKALTTAQHISREGQ